MKPVVLVVKGHEYSKAEPTLGDWYNHLDAIGALKGKNLLADRDAATQAVEYVARFFGISAEEITSDVPLMDLIRAYNQISKNIIDVFDEASAVWGRNTGKNATAPEE